LWPSIREVWKPRAASPAVKSRNKLPHRRVRKMLTVKIDLGVYINRRARLVWHHRRAKGVVLAE
jgi:hypothetical protein